MSVRPLFRFTIAFFALGAGGGWFLGSRGIDPVDWRAAGAGVGRLARGESPMREMPREESDPWRAAFVRDPGSVLTRLRGLPPLERNSLVLALLHDRDLIFAQELLESDLAAGLGRELFGYAADRALEQDQTAFLDWARRQFAADSPHAARLVDTMPYSHHQSPRDRTAIRRLWVEGAMRHPSVSTERLTGAMALNTAVADVLAGGLSFTPRGDLAKLLAKSLGAAFPGEVDRFFPNGDPEARAEYLRGAASSAQPPAVTDGEAPAPRLRGRWDAVLESGELTDDGISALRTLLTDHPDTNLTRVAHETLMSRLDPNGLLTALTSANDPAAEAFASRLLKEMAKSDPVEASRQAAALPMVSDDAIRALIDEIRNDPEASLLWAGRLKDDAERTRLTEQIHADAARAGAANSENPAPQTP